MPSDRAISFDPHDTSFSGPNYGEEGATFAFGEKGQLIVSVSEEKAVDSYNSSFECSLTMTPAQAIQLRDWLNQQLTKVVMKGLESMKIEKTIDVPATTKVVPDKFVCDLCGATTDDNQNWTGRAYQIAAPKIQVSLNEGRSYPEGGSGDTLCVDICPDCFKNKLIPWLESKGAKPRKGKWDW